MSFTNASMLDEWPGKSEGQSRLRGNASDGVQKLLRWAGVLSFLRLAVLPWLIVFAGYHRQSPITHEPMFFSSIGLGIVFLLCASAARLWAIQAVLFATAVFGAWCYYDFQRTGDLMEGGIIGKSILGLLLIYAFMQSLMSRTL